MSRVWMPLYIADYLADTAHLDNAASGSYLHLIMHYWQHGGLPSDDKKLRTIARSSARWWPSIREQLKPFFYDDWKHRRIDQELEKSNKVSCKRSAIAHARWNANSYANGHANSMYDARARLQPHINKDSLIGEENLNGAVTKTESVYVKWDTPQWNAWDEFYRSTYAKSPPKDLKGGWSFPSEWPPHHSTSR